MDNLQNQDSDNSGERVLFQDVPHNKNMGKNIMEYLKSELENCKNNGLTKQQQMINYLKLKEKQQYLEAIQYYNKALKLDPQNMFMQLQRSMNYSLTQQHDLCIKDIINLKQQLGENAQFFDKSKINLFNQYFDQLILVETDSLKFIQENRKLENQIKSTDTIIKNKIQIEEQQENIKEDDNVDLYDQESEKQRENKLSQQLAQYKELRSNFRVKYDNFQDSKSELFLHIYQLIKNVENFQITNETLEQIQQKFLVLNDQIIQIKELLNIKELNQMENKQKTEEQKSNCIIF